ncbi:hypothetical protein [Bradyrhizobium japonicum]|uniref:hypothetical protein n=1 Tax=Bradyrhizobium japonicum TaxID=375 RepID=UPI0006946499|nr:hypothetical protein [Bradyrhizobium japonicum]
MTEEQIKHLVDRFLSWHLPRDFNPDGGIRFSRAVPASADRPIIQDMPTGTNLLDARQADELVRHMIEGMPDGPLESFAWLIEAPGQHYLRAVKIGSNEFRWTKDHDEAIRFFSEQQADDTMMSLRALVPALFGFEATLGNAKAVEHGWMS